MRSFVPTETKSTSSMNASSIIAAAGVSTIIPIFSFGLKSISCSARSSITSDNTNRACRNSRIVETNGNITRTSPCTLARRIARNWVRNIGNWRRERRMLRRPRHGFRSSSGLFSVSILSEPRSNVRTTIGFPSSALITLQYAR